MDIELVREKLQQMTLLLAELQGMLPDELPSPPRLYVVKNGDYDIGDTPPFMEQPSRAREGFPFIREKSNQEEVIPEQITGKTKKAAFTKYRKEISKMPKQLQNRIMKVLEREPRFHNRVYEKRAMIDGIEVYGCATSIQECNDAFLEELARKILIPRADGQMPDARSSKSALFSDFAQVWFENVHQPKVTPITYKKDLYTFNKYVLSYFEKKRLREITAGDCRTFITQFKTRNLGRTLETCDGLLRQIFQYAVECELIPKHPMATIKRYKSVRENGVPLSIDEERAFLEAIRETKYEPVFLVSLYVGLRPCELSTARIESDFIVARNRKQKDVKRIVYKKIPITPMLKPHLGKIVAAMNDWEAIAGEEHYLSDVFKSFCRNHAFYDLRTTFATRCQECGVSEQAVQEWMGHSPRTLLGRVYTKFSDEYLLSEGKKVLY